jgi:diguanylate cyclase (GGDEF)-like protein
MVSASETEPPPRRSRPSRPSLSGDLASDAAFADFERQRRIRLFVPVCLLSALLHLAIVGVSTLLHPVEVRVLVVRLAFDATLVAAPLILRLTGSLRLVTSLVVAMGALVFPAVAVWTGGLAAPMVAVLPLAPILIARFVGSRVVLLTGGLSAADILAIALLEPHRRIDDAVLRVGIILACLCVSVLTAYLHERERITREAALRDLARRIQNSSAHDALTGLYNQGYLSERVRTELAFARRHGVDLSVILVDVDHFKRVNDRHGHAAGDDVLQRLAGRLTQSVRAEDVVGRLGGEEFLVLLRATSVDDAVVVAERMRAAVEASPLDACGLPIPVTISAGVASLAQTGASVARDLLAAADARLYAAKHAGRNRVKSHDGHEPDGATVEASPVQLSGAR